MKKTKSCLWIGTVALVWGAFAWPAALQAQSKTEKAPGNPAGSSSRIDLDLPTDSKLSDAINQLRKKYPQYGFTLPLNSESVKLGEMRVRSARLDQLAPALFYASGGAISGNVDGNMLSIAFNAVSPKVRTEVKAFPIGFYLGEDKAMQADRLGQLYEMIRSTVCLFGQKSGQNDGVENLPAIEFYNNAAVLVVVGSPEAVNVAAQIIAALPNSATLPPAAAKP